MKIVIRTPDRISEAVMAIPAVLALRRKYRDAELWVAGRAWAEGLLSLSCEISGAIPLPDEGNVKDIWQSSRLIKEAAFDAGLLLAPTFGSALAFYLAGIPERWGYAHDGRSVLLTRAVPGDGLLRPARHRSSYYADLVEALGCTPGDHEPRLAVPETGVRAARTLLAAAGRDPASPLVILAPGNSSGLARRWPAGRFAAVGALFQTHNGADIVIVGTAAEAGLAEEISSGLGRKPIDLTGRTDLRELAAVLSLASLVVANDSGPLQLANAMGTPLVAAFGPSDPAVTGPARQPATIVMKKPPCWPCQYMECPYDHRCMTAVEPADVYEAGRRFL